MRRQVVLALGGYRDEEVPEDWELWLRLLQAGHALVCLPQVLHRWTDGEHRLTRTHPRYTPQAHLRLKARHLAARLAGKPVTLWGATDVGRGLCRMLQAQGVTVERFVELHPRKLGQSIHGAPVVHPDALGPPREGAHLVACVAAKGAREEIRAWLTQRGWEETRDFTCAA